MARGADFDVWERSPAFLCAVALLDVWSRTQLAMNAIRSGEAKGVVVGATDPPPIRLRWGPSIVRECSRRTEPCPFLDSAAGHPFPEARW